MIPVKQTLFAARPGEGAGNCMAACVASILEVPLETVPNFAADEADEWWTHMAQWLAEEHGLGVVLLPWEIPHGYEDDFAWWLADETYVLLDGKSPRGDFSHMVVGLATNDGDKTYLHTAHDPHPSGEGLEGTPKCMWVLVPRSPR